MRAACGCRDPIAFGEAEAVGPSFMCTWRFMKLENTQKADIWTCAGIACGQRRVTIRKRFCILSPRQSTRKKIYVADRMCSTSSSLVLTFNTISHYNMNEKSLQQSIVKLTAGNFAGCSKQKAKQIFFWRL